MSRFSELMISQRRTGLLRDNRITNRAPSPPTSSAGTFPPSPSTPRTTGSNGGQLVTPPNTAMSTPCSQQSLLNKRPLPRPSTVSVPTRDLQALIEKTNSIDSYIKELKDKEKSSGVSPSCTRRLPRELSALVHDVYKQLKETDKDWNYTVNFDHVSNREFNSAMRTNINGLQTDGTSPYSQKEIIRSMRVYFKSLKNRHQREVKGTQHVVTKSQRRRQRMFNKSNCRLKALKESTTIDESTKRKLEPVLTVNYMSSDESVILSEDEEGASSSTAAPSKKFVKHLAMWRSVEFQNYLNSLDRKIARKKTARGRMMTVPVEDGETSARDAPMDCPDWACITLFN